MTRVTVLSSMYNDARFIRAAVESVLAQTWTDFEYLLVNDGCIDESRDIVASFGDPRIRIVDNEQNLGLTKSLNRGLALARGELIARFDANDICFPHRLERQVAFLDAHPDVAAVGGQAQIIDVHGHRIRTAERRRPVTDVAIPWFCMFDVPILHPAAMYRKKVVRDELGGYDETFRVGQDAELWSRIVRRHRLANVGDDLIAMRFDPASISGDADRPARAGHAERWARMATENMRHFLRRDDLSEEWQRLWASMNHPGSEVAAADAWRFVEFVDGCFETYCQLYPAARGDRDIARQRAFMYLRAAEKAALTGRRHSLRILARMTRVDGRMAAASVPRLAAMWAGGRTAVRVWRGWRRRNR